ncbi:MAG: diaminopimelate decarboxylase [Bacillariaceae sp.]|jgi:diaminopimelate decarboxylase
MMSEAGVGTMISPPSPRRGNARLAVAEKWKDRRKLTEQSKLHNEGSRQRPILTNDKSQQKHPPTPPLCVILRRSWNQAINGFAQAQSQAQKKPMIQIQLPNNNNNSRPPSSSLRQDHKRASFPSVLSILKANAIKLQVESMENDVDKLSVLPSNYDFATSAVNHMSHSRSRAFLLMDCSAIVQTHTVWRKRLPKKGVQMVYSARHNCNARLLQLLNRLGVGLRVATKYDLTAAMTSNGGNGIIWDDPHILVKPNSFYRNLILDNAENSVRTSIPITVNSSEEMERIHGQLYRICKRRKQSMPKLRFILKLNDIESKDWKINMMQLHKTSLGLSYEVVGVALDLDKKTTITTSIDDVSNTEKDDILLLNALSDLIKDWAQQVPDTPTLQVHLTNPINSSEIESNVEEWIENHYKSCNGIIIDVSRLLMANAAALCTRIIGVKNNDELSQQQLYIDDGFYGSLSNYPSGGTPLPLKGQSLVRSFSATSKLLSEEALVNTTVWGPTCKSFRRVIKTHLASFISTLA